MGELRPAGKWQADLGVGVADNRHYRTSCLPHRAGMAYICQANVRLP